MVDAVKTARVVVGKVSELEPKLAKLCEAQGRGKNVLERNDGCCQKPKLVLRLAIGPVGCRERTGCVRGGRGGGG